MGIAGTSEAGVLAVELSPRTKTRQYAVLTMSEWNKRSEERDNPHKEDAFYSWAQCLSVIQLEVPCLWKRRAFTMKGE